MQLQNNYTITTLRSIQVSKKESNVIRGDNPSTNWTTQKIKIKIYPDNTPKIMQDQAGRTINMPPSLLRFSNNIPTEYWASGESGAVRTICEKYLRLSVKIDTNIQKLTNDRDLLRTAYLSRDSLGEAMYCPFYDDWNPKIDPVHDKAGDFIKTKFQDIFRSRRIDKNTIKLTSNVLCKEERDDFKSFIDFLFETVSNSK